MVDFRDEIAGFIAPFSSNRYYYNVSLIRYEDFMFFFFGLLLEAIVTISARWIFWVISKEVADGRQEYK